MTVELAVSSPVVLRLADCDSESVRQLLNRYRLTLVCCQPGEAIPGSYWGEDEAGLKLDRLFARPDTPLHSILHESGHYICMSPARRSRLDTNAGSDEAEENAVCYLQALLADQLPWYGRARLFADMDAWGYSFRLGSSRAWFERDAADAAAWLKQYDIVDAGEIPLGRLRDREDSDLGPGTGPQC